MLLRPTEDDIALAFAERNEGRLAFVEELTCRVAQRWRIRDPKTDNWDPDRTLVVSWLIRELCAEFRSCAEDDDTALRLGSRATYSAVEMIARCDPRLAKTLADIGLKPKVTRRRGAATDTEGKP
jgi:hypothetical protein